jgi:2-succinyl-5-enolpyruvyl-6-hydroxy-3-cyclohexene-1-carboxylate synthase
VSLRGQVDELLARGPTSAAGATLKGDVTRLAQACAKSARGLIMVGPHQPNEAAPALARLAEITGFPLLCEATSQLRFRNELAGRERLIDGFDWLLRSERLRETLRPDLILSFGQTPTSGSYERLLNGGFSGQRFVVSPYGFPDPHGLASELVSASSEQAALATISLLEQSGLSDAKARDSFGQAWSQANGQAWQLVELELARPSPTLDEARAVRSVLDHVPSPGLLVLGNSLPIREVDAYVPSSRRALGVLSQRGANGIDGLISGAAGAASRALEPTVLLLGDVSFMHDLGGLAAARASLGPLAIVVIDNGGGRIFEQLPIFGQLRDQAELSRFWLTPQAVDISHAARLFGYRYQRVTRDAEIGEAMQRATSELGVTVVHIVVEGSSAREAEQRVRSALELHPGSRT